MANDKNFKIKNGLQAGRYLLNSSTLSGSTIDLSLASVFSTTLSSDPAYAFTNPPPSGTAQAFSVEVTGGTTTFTNDAFDTTLYTGNASSQTITNNIDLSTDGGLVWTKSRTNSAHHELTDTVRGGGANGNAIRSNGTDAAGLGDVESFTTSGFVLGYNSADGNSNGQSYVAWTFKKQAKFFDVVTYTGDGTTNDGSSRLISHNLGSTPGFYIVKRTDASENWRCFHRSLGATKAIQLNGTGSAITSSGWWADVEPTNTNFSVTFNFNESGRDYVVYLFAHDTASDSRIKCGSYSSTGLVNLGWKPQWLLIKSTTNTSDYTGDWRIFDNKRGVIAGDDNQLFANSNRAEDTATFASAVEFVNTGFNVESQGNYGTSTIYIAIRDDSATDSAITWPSSVKWPSGLAPTTPASGKKDLFTFLTTDGGTTYYGKKAGSDIA